VCAEYPLQLWRKLGRQKQRERQRRNEDGRERLKNLPGLRRLWMAMARPPMQELVLRSEQGWGPPCTNHAVRACNTIGIGLIRDRGNQLPVTSPTDIRPQTWPAPRLSGALIQLTEPQTARDRLQNPIGPCHIGRSRASRSLYGVIDPENRHAPRHGQVLAVYSIDRMASSLSIYCLVDPYRTVNRLIPPNLS
jgi:hypothetical protein